MTYIAGRKLQRPAGKGRDAAPSLPSRIACSHGHAGKYLIATIRWKTSWARRRHGTLWMSEQGLHLEPRQSLLTFCASALPAHLLTASTRTLPHPTTRPRKRACVNIGNGFQWEDADPLMLSERAQVLERTLYAYRFALRCVRFNESL